MSGSDRSGALSELTRAIIESRGVAEGPELDFKSELDLDSDKGKSGFDDDVVAFLTARGGRLVFGVAEKKGVWSHWRALTADPDELGRQIQSLVQTAVDPSPLNVTTETIALDGAGYALVVVIPESRMQPYQNRLNGAFRIRTDKQNKVLRDEIGSYFKRYEDYEEALRQRVLHEDLVQRTRGVVANDAPLLTIVIVPREHFDAHEPMDDRDGLQVFPGPAFDEPDAVFRWAPDGSEIVRTRFDGEAYYRLLIGDDWVVHAVIVHGVEAVGGGRLALAEMRRKLEDYFEGLATLFERNRVKGQFAIEISFTDLHSDPELAHFFQHDGPARWSSRRLLGVIDPKTLAKAAYATLKRAMINR